MTPVVNPTGYTPGSLMDFMTVLEQLHQTVAAALVSTLGGVRVYRWRPVGLPELPAIYPWISPSDFEVTATNKRVRDTLNVRARVAGRHIDGDQDGATLEVIIDTYRQVVDSALIEPTASPFVEIARTVDRTGMANVIDRFNDIPVLCMEFQLRADLTRFLP